LGESGVSELDAWFKDADGTERGAYYVYIERLLGSAVSTEALAIGTIRTR